MFQVETVSNGGAAISVGFENHAKARDAAIRAMGRKEAWVRIGAERWFHAPLVFSIGVVFVPETDEGEQPDAPPVEVEPQVDAEKEGGK